MIPPKTRLTILYTQFLASEPASGIVLLLCTVASIVLANTRFGQAYLDLWELPIGVEAGGLALRYSVRAWINNGLMAIFFLLMGLEIERELTIGKLSNLKSATLPIFSAVGGMVTPMLLHFLLNRGTATQRGVGIPMSTDIAFALGALALVGRQVPASLKVFLTALAIVDDLGAIAVIALFYAGDVTLVYLLLALGVWAGLLVCRRLGVRRLACYLVPGALM